MPFPRRNLLRSFAADALLPGTLSSRLAQSGPLDEGFVFRDFERSKISTIRDAIDRDPIRLSALYFTMIAFWTVMMSTGAGVHGNNEFILNLTPHVALYAAILGFFLYPARLLYVPIACFALVYAYPYFQPFVRGQTWFENPAVTADLAARMFVLNLAAGLGIGLIMRGMFLVFNRFIRAHFADLLTTVVAALAFVGVCQVQLHLVLALVAGMEDAAKVMLGVNETFSTLAQYRILRGGVVVTAFLLAAIEPPNCRQFWIGFLIAPIFPLLVVVQSAGIALYPMLDVALLAVFLVILLPVPSGILACLIGIPIYSAMTGLFLNDVGQTDPAYLYLDRYSIAALFLLVTVVAFRSMTRHLLRVRDAAMRRLYRVRDFAGLGLFSANVTLGQFRLDSSASNLLGCPASGPISTFLQCFDLAARDELTRVLSNQAAAGEVVTLPLEHPDGQKLILRLLVWAEQSETGDAVAYGLLLDVSEEEQRKEALQSAVDALSLRETTQRQLFSIVSHEVRTPASVISMLIDELPETGDSSVRRRLRNTADHLISVLGDMRQAVNPEKNLPVRLVPYVPARLAQQVVDLLAPAAQQAKIALRLNLSESAIHPREGDSMRLQQVLTNLLRNALIHSGGNEVTLSFRSTPTGAQQSEAVWLVTDNGCGIAVEDETAIFEPFERGARNGRKHSDGSGLGLYIARTAIGVLGGSLTLKKPAKGGAAFEVRLVEKDLPDSVLYEKVPPARKVDHRLSVVLAEDNPIVAEVMVNRMKRDFPNLRLVTDGNALLSACAENRPAFVVTDLFMPGLDGDEATAILRQRGFTGPIIGLTAAAVGEEAQHFIEAGANAVLFKPLNMDELHRHLLEIMPQEARDATSFH